MDIDENGKDALENAYIKAKAYYEVTGLPTIGMDNTLFIEVVFFNNSCHLLIVIVWTLLLLNSKSFIKPNSWVDLQTWVSGATVLK